MLIKTTYKEQVYQQLKKQILNSELDQDKLYSEQYFAEHFQVSRTPVREALLQLQSEGYIEIIPNRGIKVVDHDLQSLYELTQMRDAIESYCAAELARRCNEPEIMEYITLLERNVDRTEQTLIEMSGSLTPERYLEEVEPFFLEFNSLLVSPIHNRYFTAFQTQYAGRLNMLDVQTSYVPDRPMQAVQEHRRILRAIRSGNEDLATLECHHHIANVYKAIEPGDSEL